MILESNDKYDYAFLYQLFYIYIMSPFTYFIKKKSSTNLVILI